MVSLDVKCYLSMVVTLELNNIERWYMLMISIYDKLERIYVIYLHVQNIMRIRKLVSNFFVLVVIFKPVFPCQDIPFN